MGRQDTVATRQRVCVLPASLGNRSGAAAIPWCLSNATLQALCESEQNLLETPKAAGGFFSLPFCQMFRLFKGHDKVLEDGSGKERLKSRITPQHHAVSLFQISVSCRSSYPELRTLGRHCARATEGSVSPGTEKSFLRALGVSVVNRFSSCVVSQA